jgi:ATP-dependent DNA ligase
VRVRSANLAGEICCLEPDGRTHFKKLLFRREWSQFYAFDVLEINGRDVRSLPLIELKARLRPSCRTSNHACCNRWDRSAWQ